MRAFSRFRRWAVAGLTGVTVVGGVSLIGAGTSSASTTGTTAGAAAPKSVNAGGAGQAASDWFIQLPNTFATNDTLTFTVSDPGVTNCSLTGRNVGFSAAPTVKVLAVKNSTFTAAGSASDTAPAITVTPSSTAQCSGVTNDVVTLKFTNSATGTSGDVYELQVTGVAYDIGASVPAGNVKVSFGGTDGVTAVNNNTTSGDSTASSFGLAGLDGKLSNATVQTVGVTANNPPVTVTPGSSNSGISNVVITETQAGAVGTGEVCVTLPSGDTWDTTTATPTVTPSGGGAVAGAASVANNKQTIQFAVTTKSTTGPASYTLSGLAVDNTSGGGGVAITVLDGATAGTSSTACTGGTTLTSTLRAFYVAGGARIYGATADATAVAELEQEYVPGTNCPDTSTIAGSNTATGVTRAVILATDANWPDALAASYLAGKLFTGVLLTPTNSISNDTLAALRLEGITNVYIVGGNLAVSDADMSQLQGTPAYECGGTTALPGSGSGVNLQVQRVWGATADDTAQAIAQYFGAAGPRTTDIHGAYTNDPFNDTAGNYTAAPSAGALKTAFVVTDGGFQDAMSAGGLSWADGFPILLTPSGSLGSQASGALINLGIQQVIVMGGPVAVSNAVVSSIAGMNISVLRIAGSDLTDTAQFMAQFENGDLGPNDWDATSLYVARGDFYSDGLAGSVINGIEHVPLVLTLDPNTVTSSLAGFLNVAGTPLGIDQTDDGEVVGAFAITALGGPLAVSDATIGAMLTALSAGSTSA